jgi:hypothetical protein
MAPTSRRSASPSEPIVRSDVLLSTAMLFALSGCSATVHRFPLREPMTFDDDARPYRPACGSAMADCTPPAYASSFLWDGADALVFRPVTRFLAVDPAGESVDVNALDEVPDSSWFVNRIGRMPMTAEDVAFGACPPDIAKRLDPDVADGSWLIDRGKADGANPGFRVRLPSGEIYFLKADAAKHPERATGAAAIATRIYHAAGYWTSCDSVVYVRRSLFRLQEGLQAKGNLGGAHAFGEAELDRILANASHRGALVRLVASKALSGRPLGPFTYDGVRNDDPNDVVPHEDRRELRGQRVLAAWLGHFDAREQNTMTTWIWSDRDRPEGSIRHWIFDLNDCFGSEWETDPVTRRLNFSYYFDAADVARDLVTFGIPRRPWDRLQRSNEGDIFGYFESSVFDPDGWKPGYPNPAFARASERDNAWMARIIARFTPEHIARLVATGHFTDPRHADYLTRTLLERQRKILRRYFSIVSPIADLRVEGQSLCGVDLSRRVFDAYHYDAVVLHAGEKRPAKITARDFICVDLPRAFRDGGDPDDAPSRYLVVEIRNGVARGALRAHLYDLGPARGFRLVGVER